MNSINLLPHFSFLFPPFPNPFMLPTHSRKVALLPVLLSECERDSPFQNKDWDFGGIQPQSWRESHQYPGEILAAGILIPAGILARFSLGSEIPGG